MLLVSDLYGSGDGGIPIVNRLISDVLRDAAKPTAIISLNDAAKSAWLADWPGSVGADGSRARFAARALLGARPHARDMVFATHCGLAPVGRAVKRLGRGRMGLFLHGVEVWRALPERTRWGIQGCDVLVANSHFTLREFRRANPDLADVPARVVYLPARRLSSAVPANNRHGRGAPGQLKVAIVGRLWGRGLLKGQRQLIRIWPAVVARHRDAQLVIVGEGEGLEEFRAMTAGLGVRDSVTFTGRVSDEELGRIYCESAVYAMPSEGEGFGLVFAEAMSYGLPCIASRFDAGSEVVVHGETGLHVDPNDDASLLEALLRLLDDESLRRELGVAGRRRAQEHFGLEAFGRNLLAALSGDATPRVEGT